MLDTLKSFFASKKAAAAIVGIVVNVFGLKAGLAQDQINAITVICTGYMVGQGIADNGKEAAKVAKGA